MKKGKIHFKIGDGEPFDIDMPEVEFKRFVKFNQYYVMQNALDGSIKTILGKREKEKRECRFCNRKFPEVTFSNEAHVFPQLMGKAKPISHFECDTCNERFSKFEGDLSHFMLVERTLYSMKGKKKYAKFKTSGGAEIKPVSDLERHMEGNPKFQKEVGELLDKTGANLIVLKQDENEEEVIIDMENGQISFNLNKKPYRPLNVFSCFLKIGLSLISEIELKNFSKAINALQIDVEQKDPHPLFELMVQTIPVWKNLFQTPTAHLYQRRNTKSKVIDKTLVLFLGNKIYQIVIPSDQTLKEMLENKINYKTIKVSPYLNPYFSKEMFETPLFINWIESIYETQINLARTDLVRDDKYSFSINGLKDLIDPKKIN